MIPRTGAPHRRAGTLGSLLALITLCAAQVGAPPGAAAQSLEQLVAQRRLELDTARKDFEAALSAFRLVERQFSLALDEVERARRSGDNAALERAHALAQERSIPLQDREARLGEARAALDRARQALIQALDERLEQLVAQMDAAASARQRADLDVLYRDLSREADRLRAEAGDPVFVQPVVLSEIAFDPRDTPEERIAKAEILARKAAVTDTVIAKNDRDIQALESRLRRERMRRDFIEGTNRFDDTRVPVVTGQPPGGRAPVSDSTVAGDRPLTLEEQIERLREYRSQLESYRDALLVRATQFRQSIRMVAW